MRRHRAPWLRTSLPERAERASSRHSQFSERDFLGAPSLSRLRHRPSSVPPRAPRPSLLLLSAPEPGQPRGGSFPGRDIDSCRSPRSLGPRSPGCLLGGQLWRQLQRSAPSPQLWLPIFSRGRERPLGLQPGVELQLDQPHLHRAGSLGICKTSGT